MPKNPITRYILQNHVLTAILFVAIGWFVIEMRFILIALFISYIIMAALTPMVEFLKKRKIPKELAVAISYVSALLFVMVLIVPLVPFFVSQIQLLFTNFPEYLDKAVQAIGFHVDKFQLEQLANTELESIGKNALFLTTRVFGGLFFFLTIMVVSFYLMLDHAHIKSSIASMFPENKKKDVVDSLNLIDEKLGAWLRGQLVLSAFIGVITWVALTIVGIQFALPLALIAAILEIIPTIGPIIASIPAIIVALSVSPATAAAVAGIYFGIQLVENNLLVPKIMQKAVGLNPLVIIIGVILGGELMGVLGALLAVPFISMLVIVFHSFKRLEE